MKIYKETVNYMKILPHHSSLDLVGQNYQIIETPLLSYQYGMGDSKNTSLIVVVSSLTVFVFWLEWTHGKLQR